MSKIKIRTEDEVRDSAKLILGFDKEEINVQQGTGQITTFNQLGFKGVIDKPDGWYLPDDIVIPAIILETKSEDVDISLERFIGASAVNNGITAYISNDEFVHPANTITLSYNGSVGEAFYQKDKFWASDDVNVLYPKFSMNIYSAMFIIPCLKAVGKNYAFIDKWKKEDMEKAYILLPVDSNLTPNYEYMENYIKSVELKTKTNIEMLKAI